MSFHPRMPYGEGWHKSERTLPDAGQFTSWMYRLQFLGHRVEPYAALATG